MERLADLAKVLRSKNSGPFTITLDILFDDPAKYRRVVDSGVLCADTICRLYGLEPRDVCGVVRFDKALGVKATYNRPVPSGTVGDRDVYGAQQHAPLLDIMIP